MDFKNRMDAIPVITAIYFFIKIKAHEQKIFPY